VGDQVADSRFSSTRNTSHERALSLEQSSSLGVPGVRQADVPTEEGAGRRGSRKLGSRTGEGMKGWETGPLKGRQMWRSLLFLTKSWWMSRVAREDSAVDKMIDRSVF
jgi:hypothetical protein